MNTNRPNDFQKRIGWEGNIEPLLSRICDDYGIGNYVGHEVILLGYEDFNVVLETEKGKHFVKFFGNFRDSENCKRYVGIMRRVIEAGVNYPSLYESSGGYLYEVTLDSVPIRLCVMEYIDGKTLYELNAKPTQEDVRFFARQAALINAIEYKPAQVYDSWAVENFLEEYAKTKRYLDSEDKKFLEPLFEKFSLFDADTLPHCFVHGDILKTNVIKDKKGKLFILDFAVANHYPRIQELAVLFCSVLFDENNVTSFGGYYDAALSEYQKYIPLTSEEIAVLPLYVQLAHAMHVIRPTYEKVVNGNDTAENIYWLRIGKIGLRYTRQLWQN